MVADALGEVPVDINLEEATASTATDCVDLDRAGLSLAEEAGRLSWLNRLEARLGLSVTFDDWILWEGENQAARAPNQNQVSAAELRRALNNAILAIEPSQMSQPPKRWPDSCRSTDWQYQPIYSGRFAFVEIGSAVPNGLAGGGKVMALEYRGGEWQIVALLHTWIA